MKTAVVLLLCVALCAAAKKFPKRERKSYEGYKVIEVTPTTERQLHTLHKLTRNVNLDFWTEPRKVGVPVKIMVAPSVLDTMRLLMSAADLHVSVVNENVQEGIDKEMRRLASKAANRAAGQAINLDDFNTFEDIMAWVEQIKGQCPAGVTCETYSIGKSIYDYDLTVLKISKPGEGRRAHWLDSAIHAREWLAPATLMKITDHLINDYNSDETVRRLVDTYDFYILPVMNPDGYIYSWQSDRYWRKNLNEDDGDFFCFGVDLNRNYDVSWLSDGASDWVCLDIYAGSSPASEPETQAVQAEAQRIGSTILSWTSIHSFSSLWLTPFGNTVDGFNCFYPDDYNQVYAVADAAANAVERTYGTSWERGSVCEVLYAASGSTVDYVKAKAGVKYSFTPELRGTDFVIDPSEIDRSYNEIYNGMVAMIDAISTIEQLE